MTEYLLSIDPGKSSGIALLSYDEDSVPVLEKAWQFGGGVVGLNDWSKIHYRAGYWNEYDYFSSRIYTEYFRFNPGIYLQDVFEERYDENTEEMIEVQVTHKNADVIAEKFTARATKGFSYRTDALEPLRCEGALIALGIMPDYDVSEKRWLDPNHQYIVGGKDKADKKKRQHKFLKDSGFYVTGKQLDSPDADDARSTIAHGISYLARVKKHEPSYNLISTWVKENPV